MLGDKACGGVLEGMCSGGKFSAKAERGSPGCVTWLQGREWNKDCNLGDKVGTIVGVNRSRTAVSGVFGCTHIVRLSG